MNSRDSASEKTFSCDICKKRPNRDYMDDINRIMREKNDMIRELEDIVSNYQQQMDLMRIELLKRPRLPKVRDNVV